MQPTFKHHQVRPYLMADGGNVEFVEIDGLVVRLKLAGACGSCPSSLTTMTMGIKRRLMEKIPVRVTADSGSSSSSRADAYECSNQQMRSRQC